MEPIIKSISDDDDCKALKEIRELRRDYKSYIQIIKKYEDQNTSISTGFIFMRACIDRDRTLSAIKHLAQFHCTCKGCSECVDIYNNLLYVG